MTAASAPVRPAPPAVAWRPRTGHGKLFLIELRRNALPWVLPLIAVLFWFDSYRTSTGLPALWVQRTFYSFGQGHTLIDFGPFVAGVAAWMGSRDGRRGMTDLVTATARPRWSGRAATWAATTCWAVGAYLAFTGVLLAVTASQIPWGGPPWWPVAVGAAGVAAFSTAGFAAGAWFPGRFTAPVAAFAAFLVLLMSSQTGFRYSSGWALILPTNSNGNYGNDAGIFYPFLPDLAIARVMFLGGVTLAALGLIGLHGRDGATRARRGAAVLALTGVAAAATAIGLAGTARQAPNGIIIPALHDAASDRPIRYTPACGRAVIPVCVHPAYLADLPVAEAGVRSVLSQISGLPGAPVRAVQVASTFGTARQIGSEDHATITGSRPVLTLNLSAFGLPGTSGLKRADAVAQIKVQIVHAYVGAGAGPGTLAQQAVQAALLRAAGIPFGKQGHALMFTPFGAPPPAAQEHAVLTAAAKFAARPASTRHAWLAAHLGALRSRRLTLTQLP